MHDIADFSAIFFDWSRASSYNRYLNFGHLGGPTMSERLSPENERYVRNALSVGSFRSRREVLNEGVRLLELRGQFLNRLIADGPTSESDGFGEFFDEVHALGRARYEAGRGLK